jgi:hypothetical protein
MPPASPQHDRDQARATHQAAKLQLKLQIPKGTPNIGLIPLMDRSQEIAETDLLSSDELLGCTFNPQTTTLEKGIYKYVIVKEGEEAKLRYARYTKMSSDSKPLLREHLLHSHLAANQDVYAAGVLYIGQNKLTQQLEVTKMDNNSTGYGYPDREHVKACVEWLKTKWDVFANLTTEVERTKFFSCVRSGSQPASLASSPTASKHEGTPLSPGSASGYFSLPSPSSSPTQPKRPSLPTFPAYQDEQHMQSVFTSIPEASSDSELRPSAIVPASTAQENRETWVDAEQQPSQTSGHVHETRGQLCNRLREMLGAAFRSCVPNSAADQGR